MLLPIKTKTFLKQNLFLFIFSLIVMFIVAIPLIYGYSQQTEGNVFTSVRLPDRGDYWVYFSRIEQSLDGEIFHRYLFSNEALPQIQFYPIWIIFSFIGLTLSLSQIATFNFLLLALIPVFIFSLSSLVKLFIKDNFWQKLSIIFITFYSGLDWIFWPIFKKYFNYLGLDINLTDTHVFTAIFHSPHLTACLILLCWLFYCLLKLESANKIIYSWLAGILSAILFLSHPYQITTVALTLIFYFGFKIVSTKNYNFIYKLLPYIFINLLVAIYLYWLWKNFLVLKLWNDQNQILKFLPWYQSLIFLLSAIGVPLIFSVTFFKKKYKDNLFLYSWLLGTMIAIFLPIGWSIKSILGITIPLIILVCKYLSTLNNWENIKITSLFLFLFFIPGNIYLVFANVNSYQEKNNLFYYLPKNLHSSLQQLRSLPITSTILAPTQISITIPALTNQQIFCGHFTETIDFFNKCQQTNEFFNRPNKEFLLINKITHVFNLNNQLFNNLDYLQPIFTNNDFTLYKVLP